MRNFNDVRLYTAWCSTDWTLWETADWLWCGSNQSWAITKWIYQRIAGWAEASREKSSIQDWSWGQDSNQWHPAARVPVHDVTRTMIRSQNSWSPSWVPPAHQADTVTSLNYSREHQHQDIYFWHSFAAHALQLSGSDSRKFTFRLHTALNNSGNYMYQRLCSARTRTHSHTLTHSADIFPTIKDRSLTDLCKGYAVISVRWGLIKH